MSLLVDTSVWSLALRRDRPQPVPEVEELIRALGGTDIVVTTGLILQELLQGAVAERTRGQIIDRFASMPLVEPTRDDYVEAAALRNVCRATGVQLGTVDALIARLAIRDGHRLLTTDRDFDHAAPHIGLSIWRP
jgi:predicted nucleic acid-binding protein